MRVLLAFLLVLGLALPAEARLKTGPIDAGSGHRLMSATVVDAMLTNLAGAWSFRKARPAYAGAAMQIRRASGGVQDIGFTPAGDFDTAAAQAFCAATSCFQAIWYDQSIGLRNGDRSALPVNQPAIVFGCTPTGQPCLRATAASLSMATSGFFAPTSPLTFSAVANRSAGSGTCFFPQMWASNNSLGSAAANTWSIIGGAGGTVTQAAADNAWHAAVGIVQGAGSILRIDAQTETTGTATVSTTNNTMVQFSGADSTTCSLTEILYWVPYALTASERAAQTANQKNYWGF